MPQVSAQSAGAFGAFAQRTARAHGYRLDAAQLRAVSALERLHAELKPAGGRAFDLLRFFRRPQPVRGAYLWGGVGRGKSFLMDVFFESVAIRRKQRTHFHRFMQWVHRQLRDAQGEQDPLVRIGRDTAKRTRLLCLDEFHITDIGDAMLMRNLLQSLFEHGVTLVTTSNQHPDDLYEHGLQRAQFVPAIELIKTHLELVHVDGDTDYRLQALEKAGVYHVPAGDAADTALARTFEDIAGEAGGGETPIEIEGREIVARRLAQGTAWFDFAPLCRGPRGQADYIELARRFHTVLVSGVPRFSRADADARRRLTWLVDEFYDRRVKLVLSADAAPPELFSEVNGGSETERTVSRLIEMQTRQYLSEAHLA
ncbi:MAG: cell division protein ZapE [Burkholderiales bacterium]